MVIVLTLIHFLVCFFLIIVVLLQSGKAADLAGAFGGMGSQTAFGPRGSATVLSKATTIAAVVFMMTSMSLSIMSSRGTGSQSTVLERTKTPTPPPVPPAKPSITVTPEGGGAPQTIPIDLTPPPAPGGAVPAESKPAAEAKTTPEKK